MHDQIAQRWSTYTLANGPASALVLILAFCAFGCGSKPNGPPVGANLDPKVASNELATLAGTWAYERQVVEGREIPIFDMHKNSIVISGNSLIRNVIKIDGSALPPIRSTIYVDPTVSPKQIDDDATIVLNIARRLGIYKLEGDKLTLCYDNLGKKRPSTFESPVGSSIVLTVLVKVNK